MDLKKTRILSRRLAKTMLNDEEIDEVSAGVKIGQSMGNYCMTNHGQYQYQDDCAVDH